MARNFTKYTVEGLGENMNKRQLVFTIVKDWASKNNPSLEEIQAVFPDEVQVVFSIESVSHYHPDGK